MSDSIDIEKGRDGTVEITAHVLNGRGGYVEARCSTFTAAGLTAIPIDRLDYALANGDMLQIGDTLVVTLGGAAAIGATSLTVTATPGPIKAGEVMRKLSDLTGYTVELRVMNAAGDLVPVIPVANMAPTIPDQTTIAGRGRMRFAVDSTDTSSLETKAYAGSAWRVDASNHRKLWPASEGPGVVNIVDAGGVVT